MSERPLKRARTDGDSSFSVPAPKLDARDALIRPLLLCVAFISRNETDALSSLAPFIETCTKEWAEAEDKKDKEAHAQKREELKKLHANKSRTAEEEQLRLSLESQIKLLNSTLRNRRDDAGKRSNLYHALQDIVRSFDLDGVVRSTPAATPVPQLAPTPQPTPSSGPSEAEIQRMVDAAVEKRLANLPPRSLTYAQFNEMVDKSTAIDGKMTSLHSRMHDFVRNSELDGRIRNEVERELSNAAADRRQKDLEIDTRMRKIERQSGDLKEEYEGIRAALGDKADIHSVVTKTAVRVLVSNELRGVRSGSVASSSPAEGQGLGEKFLQEADQRAQKIFQPQITQLKRQLEALSKGGRLVGSGGAGSSGIGVDASGLEERLAEVEKRIDYTESIVRADDNARNDLAQRVRRDMVTRDDLDQLEGRMRDMISEQQHQQPAIAPTPAIDTRAVAQQIDKAVAPLAQQMTELRSAANELRQKVSNDKAEVDDHVSSCKLRATNVESEVVKANSAIALLQAKVDAGPADGVSTQRLNTALLPIRTTLSILPNLEKTQNNFRDDLANALQAIEMLDTRLNQSDRSVKRLSELWPDKVTATDTANLIKSPRRLIELETKLADIQGRWNKLAPYMAVMSGMLTAKGPQREQQQTAFELLQSEFQQVRLVVQQLQARANSADSVTRRAPDAGTGATQNGPVRRNSERSGATQNGPVARSAPTPNGIQAQPSSGIPRSVPGPIAGPSTAYVAPTAAPTAVRPGSIRASVNSAPASRPSSANEVARSLAPPNAAAAPARPASTGNPAIAPPNVSMPTQPVFATARPAATSFGFGSGLAPTSAQIAAAVTAAQAPAAAVAPAPAQPAPAQSAPAAPATASSTDQTMHDVNGAPTDVTANVPQ